MTMEEMEAQAIQMMLKRFHCSQATATVGMKKLGIESYHIVKAMGAFGGGLGGNGEVCGALVGGLAVIGLIFSRGKDEELEDIRMWHFTREFTNRFSREIGGGSILCRDIIQVDWTNRDQVREFYRGKSRKCIELVGKTARLLGETIEKIT